jgi:hypothetical protein
MGSGFRNIVGVLIAIMILGSCLPDPLDVKGVPQLEEKIVVSSQMIPGQAVAILLTKSIGALDASNDSDPQELLNQIIIADAAVRIESNGQTYPLTYLGSGVYGAVAIPLAEGQSYTLFVDSPGNGSVKATTTVKPTVRFADVGAELYITGRDTLADISYAFNDAMGSNWYMLNAQHITRDGFEERLLNPRVTTKMLDDVTFDGGVISDKFKILFDEVEAGDTLAVMLSNIDRDYYDFMKLREDTRFGLAAAIGEPINYPTNVEGGLGFFNLYVPDVRVFTLEE